MVMRIDDRAAGIDDFFLVLRKPVLARIDIEPAPRHQRRGGHEFRSLFSFIFCLFSRRSGLVRRPRPGSSRLLNPSRPSLMCNRTSWFAPFGRAPERRNLRRVALAMTALINRFARCVKP